MTFRQKFLRELYQLGLLEEEAKAVLVEYLRSEISAEVRRRYIDEPVANYPATVYEVVWKGVRAVTLNWMTREAPCHWARPFFA